MPTKALVDKLLTNVSNAYFPTGLIAEQIFPELGVAQDSGLIGAYGKAHLRIENSIVAGRGRARTVQPIVREVDTQYLIQPHELQGEVTESDYRNVEQPFDAEKDETNGLTSILMLEKEQLIATPLSSTAIMTQNVTLVGTSQFSDYANSNPLSVFKTAQDTVLDGCGIMPNMAIVSQKVFNTLKYHPQILENLGFAANRAGTLSVAEIASAMGVERLLIGSASYNSSKEGQADTFAQVWGKNVVFLVSPAKPEKYQQSLGYKIQRSGTAVRRVKKWNIEETFGNTGILVGDYYQFRLVDVLCGYLIKDAIA